MNDIPFAQFIRAVAVARYFGVSITDMVSYAEQGEETLSDLVERGHLYMYEHAPNYIDFMKSIKTGEK